jgi:hypothetical protein
LACREFKWKIEALADFFKEEGRRRWGVGGSDLGQIPQIFLI